MDPCFPCTPWLESWICVGLCSSVAEMSVFVCGNSHRPVMAVFAHVVAAMRARRGRGTRMTRLKTS